MNFFKKLFGSSDKEKSKTVMDEIASNDYYKQNKELYDIQKKFMGSQGTDQDVMPEGIGEFGLEITNPIPTSTIYGSISYLNKLITTEGMKIEYDRIGSMDAPNISQTIEAYKIKANNVEIATIYVCPYNLRNSEKAPKGFKLLLQEMEPTNAKNIVLPNYIKRYLSESIKMTLEGTPPDIWQSSSLLNEYFNNDLEKAKNDNQPHINTKRTYDNTFVIFHGVDCNHVTKDSIIGLFQNHDPISPLSRSSGQDSHEIKGVWVPKSYITNYCALDQINGKRVVGIFSTSPRKWINSDNTEGLQKMSGYVPDGSVSQIPLYFNRILVPFDSTVESHLIPNGFVLSNVENALNKEEQTYVSESNALFKIINLNIKSFINFYAEATDASKFELAILSSCFILAIYTNNRKKYPEIERRIFMYLDCSALCFKINFPQNDLRKFIFSRFAFYSDEMDKMQNTQNYLPSKLYDIFLINPLTDKPVFCDDIQEILIFFSFYVNTQKFTVDSTLEILKLFE